MIKLITTILLFITLNVAAQDKSIIVRDIRTLASEVGIDPDLAVSIAIVESQLNPNAVGSLGEIGLFQLRPEFHNVKKGQTKHNTKVALNYLRQLQQRYSHQMGHSWFVLYNYGPAKAPRNPTKTAYYKKVMKEFSQIKTRRYLAAY